MIPPRPARFRELVDPLRGLWLFLGVLTGWLWSALPLYPWLASIPLCLGLLFPLRHGSRVACLLGLGLQLGVFQLLWTSPPPLPSTQGRFAVLITSRSASIQARILQAPDALQRDRTVRLSPSDLEVAPGDTLWLPARFLPPRPATNPGGFDAGRWMAQAGLDGTLRAASGEPMILRKGSPRADRRSAWTGIVKKTFSRHLHPYAANLWSATALGETSFLPPEVSQAFRATGLFHLLAVSGSHMLLLGGAVFAFLRLLRLPAPAAWPLAMAAVWGYTWLLAFPPAVLRASLAFSALALAMSAGRRPDARNAWFLTAGLLLILDPNAPFHPGVQLSFAAVAGLLWVAPNLTWMVPAALRRGRIGAWLVSPLLMSVGACLTTAPVLAWHFQTVPWIGIPAGLLVGLLFEAGFLASLLVLALACLGAPSWLFWGFARAADGFAWTSLTLVLQTAQRFDGTIDTARPSPAILLLGLSCAFLLALVGTRWRRTALWASPAWLGLVLLASRPAPARTEIWQLDVGQGDAALIRFPSGRAWLVDCGPRSRTADAGVRTILPALRTLGIGQLDAVVITHTDMDHVGGLDTLLSALPVGRILAPIATWPDTAPHWIATLGRLRERGIPVQRVGAGQILSYGDGARCQVLAPGRIAAPGTNQASLVFRLDHGRSSVLFTGDADRWSEEHQLRGPLDLDADVLKVGHHGSRSSSIPDYLDRVTPGLAILSYGATNRYGHPNPEMMSRLSKFSSATWSTATQGAIRMTLDSNRIGIEPAEPRWWKGPWVRRSLPKEGIPLKPPA